MKYEYPIYYVRWWDAVADRDDKDVNDALEPHIIHSVGWLIKKTSRYITLTEEYGDNGWVRGRTTIPIKMVVEAKEIRLGKERRQAAR